MDDKKNCRKTDIAGVFLKKGADFQAENRKNWEFGLILSKALKMDGNMIK